MLDAIKKMSSFIDQMNKKYSKKYGGNILFTGNQALDFSPFQTFFPTFDWVISGIGGFPRGGMTLIHGLESTGKSTFVLESISNNMAFNSETTALYIDVESALTKGFLKFKNMFPDRLTITPLNNEDALNTAEQAIKDNVFDIIVIDSLAKLDSSKILDKAIGESQQRNRRAVIITEFLRRITFILRQSNTALVCINQEFANQDAGPFSEKTTLPCGYQQKYSANLRVQLKRLKMLKAGDKKVGYQMSAVGIKNKISSNERAKVEMMYLFDRGFVREACLLDYLKAIGYVKDSKNKTYEFIKKELYSEPFKMKELDIIQKKILHDYQIDLYKLEPGSELVFEKDENVVDPGTDDDVVLEKTDAADVEQVEDM